MRTSDRGSCSLTTLRTLLSLCLMLSILTSVACAGSSTKQDVWPEIDVLPAGLPAGLDTNASTSVLRRGDDGLLYIVGGLDAGVQPGATFLARYSGAWPLEEVARPPMAAGQITRVYAGGKVALVQLLYVLPGTELEQLEVTWKDDIAHEDIGKGVARVEETFGEPSDPESVELSLGKNLGVQPGDIYALLHARPEELEQSNELQLSRRLAGICLVQSVNDARAKCRVWHGSRLHPLPEPSRAGDTALFLEHTFGSAPRQALIQLARIEGDRGDEIRSHLIEQLQQYLNTHAAANITVEALDESFDPRDPTFYRNEDKVAYRGMSQLVMGAALVERDKKKHLIINYVGVGSPSGPGMIAAPPEGGIDMGRSDQIDGRDLRHLFGLLASGVMVYRGQTSEALMHLRQLLTDEELQGELRWHLRDQYAMRWAALGYVDEALWLVLEDEAVANAREDRLAMLNALGTRVRLLEMLGATTRAVDEAKRYLEVRQHSKDHPTDIASALSMYAEMLLAADDVPLAKAQIAKLEATCVDACKEELLPYLSQIYGSVPPGSSELRATLFERIQQLGAQQTDSSMRAQLFVLQGFSAMESQDYTQALVAFLEAERIYGDLQSTPGLARTKYYAYLAQLGMKEPLRAYETATEVIALAQELRDYSLASRVYDQLSAIYLSLDMEQAPGTYIKLASRLLTSVYEAQVAVGDLAQSCETLFSIGTLFFRLGAFDDATIVLQKAVVYGIRATRFDIAAMSHLTLGLMARARGDMEGFRDELTRAQTMAELAQSPAIFEAIDRALAPAPQEPEEAPPVDTQLL